MNVNLIKCNFSSRFQKCFMSFCNVIIGLLFISVITACSSNNDDSAPANKSTLAIPTPLQKLIVNGGRLNAFVVIDGIEENRIEMTLNRDGIGVAAVSIPSLSRSLHSFVITYEFTNANGTITLATAGQAVDLTAGSVSLNIAADDYDLTEYDFDSDEVNNAQELLQGRDPFIAEASMEISTDILELNQSAIGTLRAYVILNGDNANRVEMNIDLLNSTASLIFPVLVQTVYEVVVTFEYTDNLGTIVLSNSSRNIDLSSGPVITIINVRSEDFTALDDDNDGISNALELLAGSNPRLPTLPINAAVARIIYEPTKAFRFIWQDVPDASYYQLMERVSAGTGFNNVSGRITPSTQTFKHIVPLFNRLNTEYILQSCNEQGCIDGQTILVDVPSLVNSVGELNDVSASFGGSVSLSNDGLTLAVNASPIGQSSIANSVYIYVLTNKQWVQQSIINFNNPNATADNGLGLFQLSTVSLSGDGNTLAISSPGDDSSATGVATTASTDASLIDTGAVYIYTRTNEVWSEQAYIKANVTSANDQFGVSISMSNDGNVLAVGAALEDSSAIGIGGEQNNNSSQDSGASYVFRRNTTTWTQQAYIKASNTGAEDKFGLRVNISGDGKTLAVGAPDEGGVAGSLALGPGSVYLFILNAQNNWIQQHLLKPAIIDARDGFGNAVSLSADGNTLVATSTGEASADPNNPNNNELASGAAYVFTRSENQTWTQQAYLKANASTVGANFGSSVSLNDAGNIFAIGARIEATFGPGPGTGINNSATLSSGSGGVGYIFVLNGIQWTQQAFIRSGNIQASIGTIGTISLSGDGKTLGLGTGSGGTVELY